MVRTVNALDIEKTVKLLCLKANTVLRPDILKALKDASRKEKKFSLAGRMMNILVENAAIAEGSKLPICQDTGIVTIFVEMGSGVVIRGGDIKKAINAGVKKAYKEGFFRMSVVSSPIIRKNTFTNTPAVIHFDMTPGDKISISVMPKGFGSENKSRLIMLNPTAGPEKIVDFCVESVKLAGPDACPPYILGVGLGGTADMASVLAKKALLRKIGKANPKKYLADLEKKIKERANALGIGVMGFGGGATVIAVNILEAPTHIAGLPVAVNFSCHALRSASAII